MAGVFIPHHILLLQRCIYAVFDPRSRLRHAPILAKRLLDRTPPAKGEAPHSLFRLGYDSCWVFRIHMDGIAGPALGLANADVAPPLDLGD